MSRDLSKYFISITIAMALGACSKDDDSGESYKKAPHTGNEVFEDEENPEPPVIDEAPVRSEEGKIYYVYGTQLRIRTTPELLADGSNIAGYLDANDQVKVLSEPDANSMVEIQIVKTANDIKPSRHYYTSLKYLSEKPRTQPAERADRYKYFMIQNIATEKMRVYEKQCDLGCSHKLVLEADIAVGEQSKSDSSLMTIAGNFHINKWIKFYQDGAANYPSWYDPNYPSVPPPKANVSAWTKKKVMPGGRGSVRGAFGWFTAFPGPSASNQWTHGTLGWGVDGTKYIDATRGFWANLFLDPRSHGCSRTDNETIAYVRNLLPVGTPLIKIYAREAYLDSSRTSYSTSKAQWNYILTKNGVRVDGEAADRDSVLRRGTSRNEWLEEGTYEIDAYPNADTFKEGKRGAKAGKNGNVYGYNNSDMRGYFLIDAGLLQDYSHPGKIRRGGYPDRLLPEFVKASGLNPVLP